MAKNTITTTSTFLNNEILNLPVNGRKTYTFDITNRFSKMGWETGRFLGSILRTKGSCVFIDVIRIESKRKINEPLLNVLRARIDRKNIYPFNKDHNDHWPTGSTYADYIDIFLK